MARSATVNDLYEVEKSITWAKALQETIDTIAYAGEMSALEASIPRRVNFLHWLPACLQCLSTCRFSELQNIKLLDILEDREIIIFQKKTKTRRKVNELFLVNDEYRNTLDPSAKILHTSYDSYANDLKRSIPIFLKEQLTDHHDLTHVFRHLRASWLYQSGRSVEDIQDFLQHTNPGATAVYIHKDMYFSAPKTHK